MSDLLIADRLATADEVVSKRAELRLLASRHGFGSIGLGEGGTLVVHTDDPGYRRVARLAGEASRLVSAYVQIITDDVPAASVPTTPL